MGKFSEYAKAIGAFVVVLAGFAGALAASPALVAVFPATWIAFLAAFGVAGGIGGVVLGIPNKPQVSQVEKHPDVVKAVVQNVAAGAVTAAGAAVSDVITAYINDAARSVPGNAGTQLVGVAAGVPNLVSDVIAAYVRGL